MIGAFDSQFPPDSMKKLVSLNIALAAALCIAIAMTASDLVAWRLAHTFTGPVATAAAPLAPRVAEDLMSFAPILDKGLFGPATKGSLTPVVAAAAANKPAGVALSDLSLLGTARGSVRETFALIRRNSSHEERVFRLGDTVFDGGKLTAVQKESVTITLNGHPTTLATPDSAGAAGETPPLQQTAPAQDKLAARVGQGSYVIDQQALNAALDNIGKAMTDARLLPDMKNGKVEGFRLSEVKPAGIFGMVGLKNGDVLLRINDFPIDSPEKAIQSLVTLKGQNRVKLDLIRGDQPETFTYDIR